MAKRNSFRTGRAVLIPGEPRVRSDPNRIHIISGWSAAFIVLDFRKVRPTVENVAKILGLSIEVVLAHREKDPEFAKWIAA